MNRNEIRKLTDEQLEARLPPDDLYAAEAFRRAREREKSARAIIAFHSAFASSAMQFIAEKTSFVTAAEFAGKYMMDIAEFADGLPKRESSDDEN